MAQEDARSCGVAAFCEVQARTIMRCTLTVPCSCWQIAWLIMGSNLIASLLAETPQIIAGTSPCPVAEVGALKERP